MLWGLAACGGADITPPTLPRLPPPTFPVVAVPDTPASAAERAYYAQTQDTLLASGLLRTDGGGADARFDAEDLARNFLKLAFYDEYDPAQGNVVQQETATALGRWVQPVRIGVDFGASVPLDQQATERARIASYAQRLGASTSGFGTMTPSFFWAGLLIGRAAAPAVLGGRLENH